MKPADPWIQPQEAAAWLAGIATPREVVPSATLREVVHDMCVAGTQCSGLLLVSDPSMAVPEPSCLSDGFLRGTMQPTGVYRLAWQNPRRKTLDHLLEPFPLPVRRERTGRELERHASLNRIPPAAISQKCP